MEKLSALMAECNEKHPNFGMQYWGGLLEDINVTIYRNNDGGGDNNGGADGGDGGDDSGDDGGDGGADTGDDAGDSGGDGGDGGHGGDDVGDDGDDFGDDGDGDDVNEDVHNEQELAKPSLSLSKTLKNNNNLKKTTKQNNFNRIHDSQNMGIDSSDEDIHVIHTSTEQRDEQIHIHSSIQSTETEVPGAIAYYMLHKFDTTTNKINLLCGSIEMTTDLVNQIMGFPVGTILFDDLQYPNIDDTTYSDWQSQFDKKNAIRINEIKTKILLSDEADMNFKLNFLAIMINSLIESSSHGKENYAPLKYITKETNIRNINWCKFLIASLRINKHTYDSSNTNSFFVGPSAFLVAYISKNFNLRDTLLGSVEDAIDIFNDDDELKLYRLLLRKIGNLNSKEQNPGNDDDGRENENVDAGTQGKSPTAKKINVGEENCSEEVNEQTTENQSKNNEQTTQTQTKNDEQTTQTQTKNDEIMTVVEQSLFPDQHIAYGVIDIWVHILNLKELERDAINYPHRLFIPIDLTSAYLEIVTYNKDPDIRKATNYMTSEQRYAMFKSKFEQLF
ncbi:hypothetical protein LXL04_034020 [Taraxacum kok-saghyz]